MIVDLTVHFPSLLNQISSLLIENETSLIAAIFIDIFSGTLT